MEFDQIMSDIRLKAEERRRSDPQIEEELRRLTALPKPADKGNPRLAILDAELYLANLNYNPCQLVPGTRFRLLKRVLLRVARLFMTGQVQFNSATIRVLNELRPWLEEIAHLRSEVERLEAEQADLLELVRLLEAKGIDGIRPSPRPTREVEVLRKDLLGAGAFPNLLGFLERFRGEEAAVTEQQRRYVELFRHHEPVADLGCGRGEFVELLTAEHIEVLGVEEDPNLATYVKAKNLPIVEQNMFDFLEGLSDEALGGVFASQVIEHLGWPQLNRFLATLHRKTAVGGLVVLESINPGCLSVFAESVYLDPTHVRPYHPSGIEFLCQNLGFLQTEIEFSAPIEAERQIRPFSEFQHYAVIARK